MAAQGAPQLVTATRCLHLVHYSDALAARTVQSGPGQGITSQQVVRPWAWHRLLQVVLQLHYSNNGRGRGRVGGGGGGAFKCKLASKWCNHNASYSTGSSSCSKRAAVPRIMLDFCRSPVKLPLQLLPSSCPLLPLGLCLLPAISFLIFKRLSLRSFSTIWQVFLSFSQPNPFCTALWN